MTYKFKIGDPVMYLGTEHQIVCTLEWDGDTKPHYLISGVGAPVGEWDLKTKIRS